MEYFEQKDGRYISKGIPGAPGGSGAVRIAVTFLPVVVITGIYLSSRGSGIEIEKMLPFLIMASVFLLSSILAAVLRKGVHGSGLIVDQMNGTISYRKPGGHRHSIPLSELREIGLQISNGDMNTYSGGNRGSMLYLMPRDGTRLPLAYSRKGSDLRQFADELSIVTSLMVREHSGREQ